MNARSNRGFSDDPAVCKSSRSKVSQRLNSREGWSSAWCASPLYKYTFLFFVFVFALVSFAFLLSSFGHVSTFQVDIFFCFVLLRFFISQFALWGEYPFLPSCLKDCTCTVWGFFSGLGSARGKIVDFVYILFYIELILWPKNFYNATRALFWWYVHCCIFLYETIRACWLPRGSMGTIRPLTTILWVPISVWNMQSHCNCANFSGDCLWERSSAWLMSRCTSYVVVADWYHERHVSGRRNWIWVIVWVHYSSSWVLQRIFPQSGS